MALEINCSFLWFPDQDSRQIFRSYPSINYLGILSYRALLRRFEHRDCTFRINRQIMLQEHFLCFLQYSI